jgi:ATP-dependent DNA ligase
MKLPTLYHLGKNKSLYSWEIWTNGATIHSSTGQIDGQRVFSSKVAIPKNSGKANATTAEEQAIKEAQAMHKHKLDRKYSLTPEAAQEEEVAPMLAQQFEKRKGKNVYYPAHIQPKLDGVRALAWWDGNRIVLTSRGYQEWTKVPHINKELEKILPKGHIFDGELYVHGIGFQTIVKWVKTSQKDTLRVKLHVYDMPSYNGEDSLTWAERKANMEKFFAENPMEHVVYVPAKDVTSESEVMAVHDSLVAEGYEGAIVRLLNGLYTYGYRSYDLLKVKSFDDAEYPIVGVTQGVGKFANCAIWICKDKKGQEFKVTPKATQEVKESYLTNADKYIGQLLTVAYFGLTDDGLPRFPIGIKFRPKEDIA